MEKKLLEEKYMNKNYLFRDRTKFIPVEESVIVQPVSSKTITDRIGFFNCLAILIMVGMGLIIYKRYQNKKKYLAEKQDEYFFTGHP